MIALVLDHPVIQEAYAYWYLVELLLDYLSYL